MSMLTCLNELVQGLKKFIDVIKLLTPMFLVQNSLLISISSVCIFKLFNIFSA